MEINPRSIWQNAVYGFNRAIPETGERDRRFWQTTGTNEYLPDIERMSIPDRVGYWGGRVAGDVVGNVTRKGYWRYNHPLAITEAVGEKIAENAGYSSRRMQSLYGFGLSNVLNVMSGNTDLQNLDDMGRPRGYSAIFASPEDPTKSQLPLLEPVAAYFVGGRYKLLPFEQFHQERPDVSPEQYQRHKDFTAFGNNEFFGLENANPLVTGAIGGAIGTYNALRPANRNLHPISRGKSAVIGALAGAVLPTAVSSAAKLGLIRGAWDGSLEGTPALRMFGYQVDAPSLALTAGAGAAMYLAGKHRLATAEPKVIDATSAWKNVMF